MLLVSYPKRVTPVTSVSVCALLPKVEDYFQKLCKGYVTRYSDPILVISALGNDTNQQFVLNSMSRVSSMHFLDLEMAEHMCGAMNNVQLSDS